MTTVRLYTSPASRGEIARWMLEESGIPYDISVLPAGVSRTDAAFLKLNPMAKVPVVVHGDTVVSEAAAICLYLADAFPAAGLAPAVAERGDYYRWLTFAAGPLEAALTDHMLGFEVPDALIKSVGYGCYADVLATLEGVLTTREYIAADRFTAADVYLGSKIGFYMQFGALEKRPAFIDYCQRLYQRPAYIRAQQQEAQLLAQRAD